MSEVPTAGKPAPKTTGATPATPAAPAAPAAPVAPAAPKPAAPAAAKPAAPAAAKPAAAAPAAAGDGRIAVTFKLKAISQDEQKTVTFNYHSSQAVQRTYAPQSLFGLLAADLKREDYFIEVDLDDPFFRTFEVTAEVPFEMSRIGLRSINVALDYGNPADPPNHKHGDLVFDATTPTTQSWEVFVNKDLDLGYTPRIEYNFDPQAGWQGERSSYVVGPGWTQDRSLTLNPYDVLGFLEVQVLPAGLDPLTFSSVDVELTYASPTGWSVDTVLTVTPDAAPQWWRVRTPEPHGTSYSYRMTYHLASGGTFVTEPVTTKAASVAVDNPFAGFVQPRIRFAFEPGRFQEVQVELEHEEPGHGYRHTQKLECDGAQTELLAARFGVLPGSEDAPRWSLRAHLLGAGGAVVNGPLVETDQEVVTLTETGELAPT